VVELEVSQFGHSTCLQMWGIQVMLFGTEAIHYDTYLVLIPDVAAHSSAYVTRSVPDKGC
jgi:hypothetical protein